MPKQLIIIGCLLAMGAWFLLGEKRSFFEKLLLLSAMIFVYVVYRILSGATPHEIIAPIFGSN